MTGFAKALIVSEVEPKTKSSSPRHTHPPPGPRHDFSRSPARSAILICYYNPARVDADRCGHQGFLRRALRQAYHAESYPVEKHNWKGNHRKLGVVVVRAHGRCIGEMLHRAVARAGRERPEVAWFERSGERGTQGKRDSNPVFKNERRAGRRHRDIASADRGIQIEPNRRAVALIDLAALVPAADAGVTVRIIARRIGPGLALKRGMRRIAHQRYRRFPTDFVDASQSRSYSRSPRLARASSKIIIGDFNPVARLEVQHIVPARALNRELARLSGCAVDHGEGGDRGSDRSIVARKFERGRPFGECACACGCNASLMNLDTVELIFHARVTGRRRQAARARHC